jgi:hypothetical protein
MAIHIYDEFILIIVKKNCDQLVGWVKQNEATPEGLYFYRLTGLKQKIKKKRVITLTYGERTTSV